MNPLRLLVQQIRCNCTMRRKNKVTHNEIPASHGEIPIKHGIEESRISTEDEKHTMENQGRARFHQRRNALKL